MKEKPFYITTTLPYVNAEPHVGHALEFIRADIIARWQSLTGHEVFFNTGTDEHGSKIYQKAAQAGISTQAFVDQNAAKFKELLPLLGIQDKVNFVRTTDPHHIAAAQEFWRRVAKNGYIYKKDYAIKYCVGCELEKTDSELVNGRCPLHPLQELEIIQEENYFFKFSAFGPKLAAFYEAHPDFVVPNFRYNEIKAFVSRGLEDFSISRLKSKMPWGIEVPDDPNQVMYVWFDALVNYISAIGWPDDQVRGETVPGAFEKWWVLSGGVVQYCGKDNLRQQSAMWQAMLMAAGLPPSRTIVIDGFVTGEGGVKMSKSLGNTIDPLEIIHEYGTEAMRYFVSRELSPFEDSPFTKEKFKEAYNANLANGVGNLTSRIMKMAADNLPQPISLPAVEYPEAYRQAMDAYNIQAAANIIWQEIGEADRIIQSQAPFKLVKTDREAALLIISDLVARLYKVAYLLAPILPETAETIRGLVEGNSMPTAPLFLRK